MLLVANKNAIPVLIVPGICGKCENDHGRNWKSGNISFKERIAYLRSPKGLAFGEYIFFLKKHFPKTIPYYIIILWMKTLLPIVWDKFKKNY